MTIKLEFDKHGVFRVKLIEGKRVQTKIAEPIRMRAIGRRENGETVALIRFRTMHGGYEREFFNMSDLVNENRHRVKERLADLGYDWPEGKMGRAILDAVATTRPKQKFRLANAPGWDELENIFVTRDRVFARGEPLEVYVDPVTDAHFGTFKVSGSLEGWKKLVAKPSRRSCRLRLAIAAAFAAPFLRLLRLDSFGINLFSETSDGKTTALFVAASVPGLIGADGELPGWADSKPGIEGLARGHRDCVMPLDESADGEDEMPLEKKARMMAFLIGRNRARKLSPVYERNNRIGSREFRVVAISTSERAFAQVARDAGRSRLGGEEVRLIDVPAGDPGSLGIFDGEIAGTQHKEARELARSLVDSLKANAIRHQGHAFCVFLDKFVNDPDGLKAVKKHKAWYEHNAKVPGTHNAQFRLRTNFSVLYAGAALAIDYGILPWKKRPTFLAIEKCMQRALGEMTIGQSKTDPTDDADIKRTAKMLRESIRRANVITVVPRKKVTPKQVLKRQQADGFEIDGAFYIKPGRFKAWIPNHLDRKALQAERAILVDRIDTATVEKKIGGIKGKPRYYAVDVEALRRLST